MEYFSKYLEVELISNQDDFMVAVATRGFRWNTLQLTSNSQQCTFNLIKKIVQNYSLCEESYLVSRNINDLVYLIQLRKRNKLKVVIFKDFALFYGHDTSCWNKVVKDEQFESGKKCCDIGLGMF